MGKRNTASMWGPASVRALRNHLGLTQRQMARSLGVRQQTVSEWETGAYEPRGASRTVLSIVAERSGFSYESAPDLRRETTQPKRRPRRP